MAVLCETFRKEAGVVWNRMIAAAGIGLSLSEETLTETVLYDIALAHQGKDIVIDLATKPAENRHGADWEWWFVRGKQGFPFRVQAKRLFPNGQYQSLLKPGANPYQQLDKLVSVSKREGFQPLYCFYNFAHPSGDFYGPNPCVHRYHAPSFWGCSLAFPDEVKREASAELKALAPIMHPWHVLVCGAAKIDLVSAVTQFVRVTGASDDPRPRDLPRRVSRLIELADLNRLPERRSYVDGAYWSSSTEVPEDVAGLIVTRDLRQ